MQPKLLTEAEALELLRWFADPEMRLAELRERGLIAEPVDPMVTEDEELVGSYYQSSDWSAYDLALAALRRGKELEKPLTREMVGDIVDGAMIAWNNSGKMLRDCLTDNLHAALVEQMK